MKLGKDIWKKVVAIDMLLVFFSFSVSVIGQMIDTIKGAYALNFTQSGILVSSQSVGGLVFAVMSILYIDALNKKLILVISGLVFCVLFAAIGILPPLFMMFIIFVLIGLSGGAVNTLVNPVMAETVPRGSARFITFMHMLFSLSAIIAPFVSQSLFMTSGLTGVFLAFGGFGMCWAVYAAVAFRKDIGRTTTARKLLFSDKLADAKGVFLKPGMKQIFIITICIAAWQMGAIYNVSSYIRQISGSADAGALALSVLFGGMMLSRLLYSRIADRFPPGRVVMLTNLLGALAWGGVVLADGIVAKTVLIGVAAFFCANNMPIAFSSAYTIAPKKSATASGFVILGYYIAIFTFIPIIGALGDAMGLSNAFVFIGVPLLFVVPVGQLLYRSMKGMKTA